MSTKSNYAKVKGYYPNNNTVFLGGHKITLKDCKKQIGHDDSTPYAARLFVDNKLVCTIYNDGWGGESSATQISDSELLNTVNKDIQGLPYVLFPWDKDDTQLSNITISSIFEVCDAIAEHILYLKEMLKSKGAKRTIVGIKGCETRYATLPKSKTPYLTLKDMVTFENKCNELIKLGYTIVNCPQFFFKDNAAKSL